eukprot:TRINITY_DN68254_c0_g1_i1.p1 TRINITY_DN68254_c0_g1~~TRINITY_DN68254_c0_g1_i1.p1  ORF type:complete len:283 (+),score=67.65 TRINITY_DN68254_c0_g1_i1:85-933(+)
MAAAAASDMDRAVKELKFYDLAVDLIGSQATNLASKDSDINVLVSMPLKYLRKEVEEAKPPIYEVRSGRGRFCLEETLFLLHIPTGVELAVLSRWSADIFMRERDLLMTLLLEYDDRVPHLLRRIGEFYSRYRDGLPLAAGFPSRYLFMLTGIHFLMSRVMGYVLPPLAQAGPFIHTTNSTWEAGKKAKGVSERELYEEWLKRLSRSDTKGLFVDIRNPYSDVVEGKWRILDPASCLPAVDYDLVLLAKDVQGREQADPNSHPGAIALAARHEIAAMKNSES